MNHPTLFTSQAVAKTHLEYGVHFRASHLKKKKRVRNGLGPVWKTEYAICVCVYLSGFVKNLLNLILFGECKMDDKCKVMPERVSVK